jgi:hypothetical protein
MTPTRAYHRRQSSDTVSVDRRTFGRLAAALTGLACTGVRASDSVRDTAAAAYVWGYPTVDLYAILRGQALDHSSPEFRAPLNAIGHARQVTTPEDRLVIAPNVDTPYSHAWLDLRAEPVVFTMPAFERERYVSLQLFDLYTWITGYVSPRTNGQAGGDFLIAAPGWQGEVPPGIRRVFRSTTTLALGMVRAQLFDAGDLPKVHALQDGMRVRTLSAYLGRPGPSPLPMPALLPALNLRREPTAPRFFDVLNWMLAFMPVLPEEAALRRGFESLGLAAGQPFAARQGTSLPAVVHGMKQGLGKMVERSRRVRSSAEIFGSREFLSTDYLARAVGAMLGILGNAGEEYLGVGWQADVNGQAFDGRKRYRIRFAPGQLPPVDAFWSITVYTQERLLYANPLRRYVINTPMLPRLKRDADGSITLHVQHDSPGAALEDNWLPVPAAPFGLTFRTYLPRAEIRNGAWTAPPVVPYD